MATINTLYFATYLRSLGGVPSVLKHHLNHDAGSDIDARYVIFFERHDPPLACVDSLGWNWRVTIPQMRRSFGRIAEGLGERVAIYHDLWGVCFLADLDRAVRRVGYLHSYTPDIEATIRAQRGLVDGMIAISQALADAATRLVPELAPDRICLLPLPIQPPRREYVHSPPMRRPIVLGYSGRLVRQQKRIDRFLELARQLSRLEVAYRLEFLGDGRDAVWLKRQLSGSPQVVFHGSKSGNAYWDILAGWDALIYVSDFEGTPISLLEGLSCGVLPVFPRIASGGVAYAQKVSPLLVYEPGDMAGAARAVQTLCQLSPCAWLDWRAKGRDAVRGHLGTSYIDTFRNFLDRIEQLPRISQHRFARRPFFLTDYLPLGYLARLARHGLLKHGPLIFPHH